MGRRFAALSLVALLTLAGCSLPFAGGSPTASPSPSGTGAGDGGTPTPTFAYPAGYAANGVTNATAAVVGHREALLGSSGFSLSYNATVRSPDRTTVVTLDEQVETDAKEALVRTEVRSGNVSGFYAQYYADDTVYVKSRRPGASEVSYSNASRSYDLSEFVGARNFVRPFVANVSYGSSEVTTRGGESVVVYSDATLENASAVLGRNVRDGNVTDFSATLVVDPDGYVREVRYGATVVRGGTEKRLDVTVTVRKVGATTVEGPSWVSRA